MNSIGIVSIIYSEIWRCKHYENAIWPQYQMDHAFMHVGMLMMKWKKQPLVSGEQFYKFNQRYSFENGI